MSIPNIFSSKIKRRTEKGQVLIIVAFAIVGLVAFIGLVVDLGLTYIGYGNLRRSVDAAALAASLQYREGYTLTGLQAAATEFMVLNGVNDPSATVMTCEEETLLCDTDGDGAVSENEHRKLVHVIASSNVELAFLKVIGIYSVPLQAEAVSEAASVDVVLAIDRSESMTSDGPALGISKDPSVCNADAPGATFPGDCQPFEDVRRAAADFVDNLFFPYDRVAVVTFDRHLHCSTCSNAGDNLSLALSSDKNAILHRIRHLWVYQAGNDSLPGVDVGYDPGNPANVTCEDFGYPNYTSPAPSGPCRRYNADQSYGAFDCPAYHLGSDPSSCTTTNIGGGLVGAGNEFAGANSRKEALWVVILLTDGAANSSTDLRAPTEPGYQPHGFCPDATKGTQPFCRDNEFAGNVLGVPTYVNTRHCYDVPGVDMDNSVMCEGVAAGDEAWDFAGIPDNGSNYDADDFARDMADWLALNNMLTFSIGLGDQVTNYPQGDPNDGEELLQYVAGVTDGLYFGAPNGDDLRRIFAAIADNIATRLTR